MSVSLYHLSSIDLSISGGLCVCVHIFRELKYIQKSFSSCFSFIEAVLNLCTAPVENLFFPCGWH